MDDRRIITPNNSPDAGTWILVPFLIGDIRHIMDRYREIETIAKSLNIDLTTDHVDDARIASCDAVICSDFDQDPDTLQIYSFAWFRDATKAMQFKLSI